ncbi:MAG: hypothetical protein A3K30_03300 [Deltaproteobacteria bacterium RBG_13_51_10]|nr:MAG: hypothetical protein A3K30_03300 [Deltaproteobacteria bacterium RBG_13_51_10]
MRHRSASEGIVRFCFRIYQIRCCLFIRINLKDRLGGRAPLWEFGIAAIGTISRRMERMANSTALAQEARVLIKEVQLLETHLEQFEKYLKK